MKTILLPIIVAGLFSLAGCSSTSRTHVDSGPVKAATFNFVRNGDVKSAEFAENRQAIHAMIQGAIANNLTRHGMSRASGTGDLTVAYLVIVGNGVSTISINDYFGYGRDATGLEAKAQDAYTGSKNPNYFEAGTLVIDILDTKTFKLLKRSYAVKPILRNPPPDVRQARIQEAVDEALKDLRFAR